MLQSFFVYTFFALAMYIAASSAMRVPVNNTSGNRKGLLYYFPMGYIVCVLLFFLISGFRYNVGVDHLGYLSEYLDALRGVYYERDRGYEIGFKYTTVLFGNLGIHPIIYFGFLGSIQLLFVMLAYRKERSIMPYMMLLLLLGGYFFTWMNGIRQLVAACIFVFSIQYIKDRSLWKFLICILLAATWHKSVIIMVPFYLLTYDKTIWNKKWILLGVIVACFVIGNTPTWVSNISQMGLIMDFMGYDFYADRIDEFMDESSFTSFNFGPRMLLILVTYILIVYLYPKTRSCFQDSNIDISFKLCFLGICGYYLFVNTTMNFLRPFLYFTIFALPLSAYTLVYLIKKKKTLLLVIFLVATMTNTYLSCLSDARAPITERKSYLYHFYFDNVKTW